MIVENCGRKIDSGKVSSVSIAEGPPARSGAQLQWRDRLAPEINIVPRHGRRSAAHDSTRLGDPDLRAVEPFLSGASAKLLRHLARRRPRSGARGGAAVYGPRRKDACARSSTRWRAGRLLRSAPKSRSGGP